MSDVAERLDRRMTTAERRLDGAIAHRALVRYDAYNELSGRQSTSIALLDAERVGVVLSSIHHREQARLYAKQVHDGQGELELSPEEAEAVRLAVSGGERAPRRPPADARRLPRAAGHRLPRGAAGQRLGRRAAHRAPGRHRMRAPVATVYDAVMAVHDGEADRALVPIENSLEGTINPTLDTLAIEADDVGIVGELVHPVRHCLIARPGVTAEDDR